MREVARSVLSCMVDGADYRYYVGTHTIKIGPNWSLHAKFQTEAEAQDAWKALTDRSDTSTAVAKRTTRDEALMARQLSDQYGRAVGGLWEVVKFGAMMMHLATVVSTRGHDSIKDLQKFAGDGVKAWLAEHCPEISRPTAYRFKGLAEGLQKEFKLGEPADLHRILTAGEDGLNRADRKMREQIAGFLEDKSQRQLQFRFMAAPGAPARKPVISPKKRVALRVQTLVELRAACKQFLAIRGHMDDEHFDTGCALLVSTLEEATACKWDPNPDGDRKRHEFVEHAHCYEVPA